MKGKIKKAIVILAWLCVFELAAMLVNNPILFIGPIKVLQRILELLFTADFYVICLLSFGRILFGMISAFLLGIIFGFFMHKYLWFEDIWSPLLSIIKSIPVASFVVLLLIWQGAERLSVFISFFVVFPHVCISMKNGLSAIDPKMAELADVYKIRGFKKWLYIYRPVLLPYLISCMEISVGMSFKSGVAAEVIGTPDYSIGERIYISKIYLDTAGLFAWTLILILLSFLTEKIILLCMKQGLKPLKPPVCRSCTGKLPRASHAVAQKLPDEKNREKLQDKITDEIKILHLKKSYQDTPVFEDLNLTLKRGGRYCITAPSGSGKTTLFRILTGLTDADGGEVKGTGEFAYLFQEDRFAEDELTINNIMLTAKRSGLSVSDVISMSDGVLSEEAMYLPVKALSGGMKRRAALIRALLYQYDNPSAVCLLDEPFAGLDEETKKRSSDFIKRNLRGRTLIVAVHEERDVKLLEAKTLNIS